MAKCKACNEFGEFMTTLGTALTEPDPEGHHLFEAPSGRMMPVCDALGILDGCADFMKLLETGKGSETVH